MVRRCGEWVKLGRCDFANPRNGPNVTSKISILRILTSLPTHGRWERAVSGCRKFQLQPIQYTLRRGLRAATLLLSALPNSHDANTSTLSLGAWESRIYNAGTEHLPRVTLLKAGASLASISPFTRESAQ